MIRLNSLRRSFVVVKKTSPINQMHPLNWWNEIKNNQEKVKILTPVSMNGVSLCPVKVASDGYYEGKDAKWCLQYVPRSLTFILDKNSVPIRVIYGLRKFGSLEETKMGSNITINEWIRTNVKLSISVAQKHNGEAATISAQLVDGVIYFLVLSKSVPVLVRNRRDVDLLDGNRFATCKEIAGLLFDIVEKLSENELCELQKILLDNTFAIEKIDKVFKHIACEEAGLYVLVVRDNQTDCVIQDNRIIGKMKGFGFKESVKYTDANLGLEHSLVKNCLAALPQYQQPSIEQFNSSNPKDLMDTLSYTALVSDMVKCPAITAVELLELACGLKHPIVTLIEGTILNVRREDTGELLMIKTKGLIYYLIRAVRTQVERYCNKSYDGKKLHSNSMNHWVLYMTPSWRQAWDELLCITESYLASFKFKEQLSLCCAQGHLDSPEFFKLVMQYHKTPSAAHKPILVVTTETQNKEGLNEIFEKYGVISMPSKSVNNTKTHFASGTIYLTENYKVTHQTPESINVIGFSTVETSDNPKIKSYIDNMNSMCIQNRARSLSQLDGLIKHYEKDVQVAIISKQFVPACPFKYFESTNAPYELLEPLVLLLLRISSRVGKSFNKFIEDSDYITDIQFLLNAFETHGYLTARNPNAAMDMCNRLMEMNNNNKGKKLVVFTPGIPGIGKDYCVHQALELYRNRNPNAKLTYINQDQFSGDAPKYQKELKLRVEENDIVVVTRNGPGSKHSLDIAVKAGATLGMIYPTDSPLSMLCGSLQYAMHRHRTDPTHVLSQLSIEKNISVIFGFFLSLMQAQMDIMDVSVKQYYGICLENDMHVTLQYGILTDSYESIVNNSCRVVTSHRVSVQAVDRDYKIEFFVVSNMINVNSNENIMGLVESGSPHITILKAGNAENMHSGWWCSLLQSKLSNAVTHIEIDSYRICITPEVIHFDGTIELCNSSSNTENQLD